MTTSNSIQLKLMKGSQLVSYLLPSSDKPVKFKILVSLDKEKKTNKNQQKKPKQNQKPKHQLWKIGTGKKMFLIFPHSESESFPE